MVLSWYRLAGYLVCAHHMTLGVHTVQLVIALALVHDQVLEVWKRGHQLIDQGSRESHNLYLCSGRCGCVLYCF